MKLAHVNYVLAIAECGSLRAASRHLGIAQPAMTRSIRDIETELGVSLFERHAKGARLTAIGEAFVARARGIDQQMRKVKEEIEQLKGETTGEVSIALSQAACISLLPKVLPAFQKRFPEAVLQATESLFQGAERGVHEGEFDFYVGALDTEISSTSLRVESIFDNSRYVIARRGHPLAEATELSQLARAEWIRPTMTTRTSEADFNRWFERRNLPPPKVVMHARSALLTLLAITSSDLLTILPRQWLEYPLTSGSIETLKVVEPMRSAPVCIVRRSDFPLTPAAEYLYDQFHKAGANYARASNLP